MLATMSNMPKWLLALLAFCILAGYQTQIQCKINGCQSDAVAHADGGDETSGDQQPDTGSGEHHCQCQCHFATFVVDQSPQVRALPAHGFGISLPTYSDRVPEALCAEIEHPPQLA